MSATVLYMSMTLDGFIAGPNESPDNGLGDGGDRLHEWAFPGAEGGDFAGAVARLQGVNRQVYDEFMSTGAVIAGRGTFEPAEGWGGDHHDGVPIYVLSRHPAPDWTASWPNVHYVSDLQAAVRDARHAAGDTNVLVHGAGIAQRAIPAGLLDEIEIHLVPVLFGDGRRLFEQLGVQQRELERTRVLEGEAGVTHLHYRIRREVSLTQMGEEGISSLGSPSASLTPSLRSQVPRPLCERRSNGHIPVGIPSAPVKGGRRRLRPGSGRRICHCGGGSRPAPAACARRPQPRPSGICLRRAASQSRARGGLAKRV